MNTQKIKSKTKYIPLFLIITFCLYTQSSPAQHPKETKLGIELYNQNKIEEAIKTLRIAVQRDKKDAEAFSYLGLALSRSGNDKEARKAFEQDLKINPNDIQARVNLSLIFLNLNKLSDAEKQAKKLIELNSKRPEPHYIMALTYLEKTGKAKDALDSSEQALKLDPTFSRAFYSKSLAYINLFSENNTDDEKVRFNFLSMAADALDEYLKLEPKDDNYGLLKERAAALHFYAKKADAKGESNTNNEILAFNTKDITTNARITFNPQPEYTERARVNQIQGVVRVMATLSADGKVKYLLVVRGLPSGLTEKALKAAKKIVFIPATKDGKPVSQMIILEYNFRVY